MNRQLEIWGWGRFPREHCNVYRPESIKGISDVLCENEESFIARGLGRSYGDTALNNNSGVILTSKINRFISFDPTTFILTCEAGVSLEDILLVFVPKGYFLPVTPGTKYVTIGGAVANDVHGKNHHKDGSISEYILGFNLLTANGDTISCSRSENPDVFWATIGGIGLTGIITTVSIKLIPIDTSYIAVDYTKAKNIEEAFELFATSDENYKYSVAWIDCLATGKSLGRSVLMRGNHASIDDLSRKQKSDPLSLPNKHKFNVPIDFPSFTLNYHSIHAFNGVYYRVSKNSPHVIVDYDSFFYPLDSVLNWNRLYGKNGFIQYQAIFPPETGRKGLVSMLKMLSKNKRASFLAVLKTFGKGGNGLLSFPQPGYTLALDIPIKGNFLFNLVKELDDLVLSCGGRVYLAKDSLISPYDFQLMYPRLNEFKQIKGKIDPNNVFLSSMAKRLRIVED